ncbi:lipid asymmetry maintenance protein MlaB [Pseudomonas sp. DNDY-54]|uniref:STAS domain-containing protein n=1 Tax=Pseudomonas sp. DNDY-54 TaxID=2870860 RepID=UPI001CA3D7DD|nr:STAS domain-containing protein [Pseudomonas sp. DNDY-54]
MSNARVERGDSGELQLFGVLDYQSGPALRQAGQALIRAGKGERLLIDCSSVEKSSSVGLSLLLAFTRDARASERQVEIIGVPEDMREIAKVSGLLEILPLAGDSEGAI